MFALSRKGVSPVIAIVLLLMMTVAAAGAAYFWLTTMQSSMQESSRKSIENIMEATGRRVTAQATLCKPTYPYKGLKGYWMMDDYNSTGVLDVSGNNNFGTFEGTAFGTDNITGGQVGKALDFDGVDDYVEVPDDESLDMADSSVSISFWVKSSDSYTEQRLLLEHDVWGGPGTYQVTSMDDNTLRFNFPDMNANEGPLDYNVDFTDGQWHHIVGMLDTQGDTAYIYYDGQLGNSKSVTSEIGTATAKTYIGARGDGSIFFNGKIDEVRIYNRALSKNEIQELYEAENHSARRRIDVTVRNIGSEEIPKATWVANLKHDGTTVETDAYNASSIDTGELATLKFYFKNFKPNTEYTIELQGTGTSTTVSC